MASYKIPFVSNEARETLNDTCSYPHYPELTGDRPDGLPVVHVDGYQEWWVDGKRHRLDAPVAVAANGSQAWHVNGNLHRLDGPAIIRADGYQEWYVNGERHRLDGPAVIHVDGSQQWWVDGKLHRVDGPAVIYADGLDDSYIYCSEAWFFHDEYSMDTALQIIERLNLPHWSRWTEIDKLIFRLALT